MVLLSFAVFCLVIWTACKAYIHTTPRLYLSSLAPLSTSTLLQSSPSNTNSTSTSSSSSSSSSSKIYTNVNELRSIFGSNKNKLWGDLDNAQTRRLYHELLPKALLKVERDNTLTLEERAVIASKARTAAKKYARERCTVPGRVLAYVFDGFRHLKEFGTWSWEGMSWEEVWLKYENEIKTELSDYNPAIRKEGLTQEICKRILERSCATNAQIDQLLLLRDGPVSVGEQLVMELVRDGDFLDMDIDLDLDMDMDTYMKDEDEDKDEESNANVDGVINPELFTKLRRKVSRRRRHKNRIKRWFRKGKEMEA